MVALATICRLGDTCPHLRPARRIIRPYIEALKAENEILKRRLVAAEAQAAQETARVEEAIAKFAALTKRLDALASRARQALVAAACGLRNVWVWPNWLKAEMKVRSARCRSAPSTSGFIPSTGRSFRR